MTVNTSSNETSPSRESLFLKELSSEPAVIPVFDRAAALARASGDEELLEEITEMFLSGCPAMISDIREAIALGDCKAMGFAAHKLKGTVGIFEAPGALLAVERLENLAAEGHLAGGKEALKSLEEQIERLSLALGAQEKSNAYINS
jgi:HPt (histidine-containing phosphotransfer) domain-containing protein